MPHGQVATAGQPLGVEAGGPIKGRGDRGPPVHHQGFAIGTRHRQPADVERLAELVVPVADLVDPPEAQPLVPDVQLGQAGQAGPHDDVPLGPGLRRAPFAQVENRIEHGPGLVAHGVEARVGELEELLLLLELGIRRHAVPSCPPPERVVPGPPTPPQAGGRSAPAPRREAVHSRGWQ